MAADSVFVGVGKYYIYTASRCSFFFFFFSRFSFAYFSASPRIHSKSPTLTFTLPFPITTIATATIHKPSHSSKTFMKTTVQKRAVSKSLEATGNQTSQKRSLSESSEDEDDVPLIQRRALTKRSRSSRKDVTRRSTRQQEQLHAKDHGPQKNQPTPTNRSRSPTQSPTPARRRRQQFLESDSEDESIAIQVGTKSLSDGGDDHSSTPTIVPSDCSDDMDTTTDHTPATLPTTASGATANSMKPVAVVLPKGK